MGSTIIGSIAGDPRFELLAISERGDFQGIGKTMCGARVVASSRLPELLEENAGAIIVDFTAPEVALENVRRASSNGCNSVVGTTGFTQGQLQEIASIVKGSRTSAVVSPNFSIGVNVFWRTCEMLAKQLPTADIEVIEYHHRGKKDAPSGTAKRAAELVAAQVGIDEFVHGRKGMRPRGREIGVHAVRGGDIVGEHTVMFAQDGERIELTHRAHSRLAFAGGCLRSIEWVHGRKDGAVHTLYDVLGM
jgi:4-hydroxy-tetrahydrodipicolinate reductase